MRIALSENIRTLRKERGLTQEQLAEALGVTTGAVHKWEAGLSTPELDMIIKAADFFDSSVDALLGYRIKDDRREAIGGRLTAYLRTMDPQALEEAENALKKYPNNFQMVYTCASIFLVFGTGNHDEALIRRSLELLERSLLLLPQNTDEHISLHTIYHDISAAYFALGEIEKSLELMKKHNEGGTLNDQIGVTLALLKRPDEAVPYLSGAMLQNASGLLSAALGLGIVFTLRGDHASAEGIRLWGLQMIESLREKDGTDSLDKMRAEGLVQLAQSQLRTKGEDAALETLREAAKVAERFDSNPDYGLGTVKYLTEEMGDISSHDIMGATAAESIDTLLGYLDDAELTSLWKTVVGHE